MKWRVLITCPQLQQTIYRYRALSAHRGQPLSLAKWGSMFEEDGGLSPHLIADLLAERSGRARLVSIEYELIHIDASRATMQELEPSITPHSPFLQFPVYGTSLSK